MKIPIGLTQHIQKLGYKPVEMNWRFSKGMAYQYFVKRKKGYLITICTSITGYYLIEILKRHDLIYYSKKGFKIGV